MPQTFVRYWERHNLYLTSHLCWFHYLPILFEINLISTSLVVFWGLEVFFFFSALPHTAYGILVPWPGIKPVPSAVEALEAWHLDHQTTRAVLNLVSFILNPCWVFFSFIVLVVWNNHSYPSSQNCDVHCHLSTHRSVVSRSGSKYKTPLINALPCSNEPGACLFKYDKERKQKVVHVNINLWVKEKYQVMSRQSECDGWVCTLGSQEHRTCSVIVTPLLSALPWHSPGQQVGPCWMFRHLQLAIN